LVVRGCFWNDPAKDAIMRKASEQVGATWVDISELGKDEKNSARSERDYKDPGVAGHPGDRGMEAIANAIWTAIQK
jgi:hypothetical protein